MCWLNFLILTVIFYTMLWSRPILRVICSADTFHACRLNINAVLLHVQSLCDFISMEKASECRRLVFELYFAGC